MRLSTDNTNLGMMLPMRAGMGIAEYLQAVIHEFREDIIDDIPALLCVEGPHEAVIFFADADTEGGHFQLHGCEGNGLLFRPRGMEDYSHHQKALIFVEIANDIYAFFADIKYLFGGDLHLAMPRLIYKRSTRHSKRVKIEGQITLKKKNGWSVVGTMHDFSPTGASFYVENGDFSLGENVLAEFEIPDCGMCETVVTVVRVEPARGRLRKILVAFRMALTKEQKRKAEQLYLCKKAEEMRKIVESSRSHRHHIK